MKNKKEILLKTEGTFHKYFHYSHVSFLFPIEKKFEAIIINFSYRPLFLKKNNFFLIKMMKDALKNQIYRTDEPYVSNVIKNAIPIKNQISIAVKDPNGWRGEHHFFPGKEQIVLGKTVTTDGFVNTENETGMYELVLHIFGIYTDKCDYILSVIGEN
ncbi:hypothetical protein V1L52_05925 [Treponema sp. HNW]|uniref:hypothetical protein n=1 Tax=Treponema sp. HNW TaxID=3116654 RepID=UPI003D0A8DC0